ncbi:NAD(P)/FAD-dependent oxidoreductase [Paracoccaceae bacterium Fryx2]|nr:NAD(P)/FAD-dependent oxidoreductase [Paracoccaceae bacterium Fryx2]
MADDPGSGQTAGRRGRVGQRGDAMLVLVVGAGVLGLACARALALAGHDVVVAEAARAIGQGISSRNSEVVHGGMYYPAGSARHRHCIAGRRLLYAFCASHAVPHRRCGKLVVATTPEEEAKVARIHATGIENGVEGLRLIDRAEAQAMEPALSCRSALWSPETGIVDSHAFMLALSADLTDAGGVIALDTPVLAVDRDAAGYSVTFGGAEPGRLTVDALVNAAGLGAQALARRMPFYPENRIPPLVLAKGNYFGYSRRPPFSRLVYPAPVDGGLGIHATLDMAGRMRFGPDVEWVDTEDYRVDPLRAEAFYARIRTYFPGLPDGSLAPDYAGLRPKLTGPGVPAADFRIDGPEAHGMPGLVQLFGIESPGLTASLSIAAEVASACCRSPAPRNPPSDGPGIG